MTILVTGAAGYVGIKLARTLLAASDEQLILTVRTRDEAARAALLDALGDDADGRVEVVAADVRRPDGLASVDPVRVTRIVHAAAIVRFNVEEAAARETNVAGTTTVSAFARRCPRLARLVMLSTIYSAGRREGAVDEVPLDEAPGHGFVNFYEWSKAGAEAVVSGSGLPVSIARLATVIADDEDGAVTQYNAFHNTLKLFYYGLLSLVPGDPSTPLYLTTGRFVAEALAAIASDATPPGIYHVSPSMEESATLGDLVDLSLGVFESHDDYRRRRLLRPLFCDERSFEDLVDASQSVRVSPLYQALASVAPFARQLYLHKEVHNPRLRAVWPAYDAGDARLLVEATCEHLVATRWGRRQRVTT